MLVAVCALLVSIGVVVLGLSRRSSNTDSLDLSDLQLWGHYPHSWCYPTVGVPAKDVWDTTIILSTPDGQTETFKKQDMLGCWFWDSEDGWYLTAWGSDWCVCYVDMDSAYRRVEIANPDEWVEMYTSETPEAFLMRIRKKMSTDWDQVQDARIDSLMERIRLRGE